MKFDIGGNPSYGDLTIALAAHESVWSEGGAMSRMSGHMELRTQMIGGLLKSVVRRLVGGESLFISEYTAPRMAFVSLAPTYPGCILHREMKGDSFFLTSGSFLACTPGMNLDTRFGGLRAFFSGEGGFLIEVSGQGDLFYNAYGGVVEKPLPWACCPAMIRLRGVTSIPRTSAPWRAMLSERMPPPQPTSINVCLNCQKSAEAIVD
ncbi:MAG: TIGR00266 family protein [Pirellulaceae bacterium]